jgi:hypothetical protein
MVRNGNQVLDALGLTGQTYAGAMQSLALLTFVNLVLTWIGLAWQQRPAALARQEQKAKPSGGSAMNRKTPTVRRLRL